MAPKTTAANGASTILADALSSFSKAAHQALVTVEEKAKSDVARAHADVHDLRRERDEVVRSLHAYELQVKECECRAEGWKTSVEKSELTIKHQVETIAQLRDESQQWKNQLLRFEDASRREIQDWKDQYQRAEIERIRLSARLDELIAEQLHVRVVVRRTYQALTKLSVEHTCQRKEPRVRNAGSCTNETLCVFCATGTREGYTPLERSSRPRADIC
ncbi:hypothetical protein NM688_g6427 [Phlebia brevispora]|uniref:Uncharacterized protein n=1 Tax=Phlebia brevispora TaxID=194682 RepID=A0ACC1SG32_9APHY|nr:hypothetical protein NM688_g6427 [Phlebia brevispora]